MRSLIAIFPLAVLLCGQALGAADKPNIIFIFSDDHAQHAISAYGSKVNQTPHLDRLAAEGARFTNSFVTNSICTPSRATLLTGQYSHLNGVPVFNRFDGDRDNVAKHLQAGGYHTGMVGKWHLGSDPTGFDRRIVLPGQGAYWNPQFLLPGKKKLTIEGHCTDITTDLGIEWLKTRPQDKPFFLGCVQGVDDGVGKVLDYIDEAGLDKNTIVIYSADNGWYLGDLGLYDKRFMCEPGLHVPLIARGPGIKTGCVPEQFVANIDLAPTFLDMAEEWIKQRLSTWHGIYGPLFDWRKKFPDDSPEAVKDFEAMTRAYWGTLLSVDDSVGRLYELLKQRGELDNTIIVFMSDNGILNGEHGMVDKRTAHEPSIRIVQVVRFPGLAKPDQPKVIERQVLTVDLAPSLLELCGAPALENIHGKSWVKLVREGDDTWRKAFFYYYNYEKQFPYTPNVRSVRTETWKYTRSPHGDGSPDRHPAELYNIEFDPEERHNLAANPKYAGVVKEMQIEMLRVMKDVGLTPENDKMPLDEGIKSELPDEKIR